VLDGCGVDDLGLLVGHRVHWGGDPSLTEAVAEVYPPKPHSCWVLTALVVRYDVAGRRYRATYPDAMATCRGLAIPQERAVLRAAGAARPGI
jgi:hypothetical protein